MQISIQKKATGSTATGIKASILKQIRIPLPPLPTQHKIVEILEEADNLRKFRQQADEKMKDLIPSLYTKMFGDPVTNPKGWEVKKLVSLPI
jgi:type I restriction enzyme S subunit